MKITNKEIKECECNGIKEMVLFVDYTHKKEKGSIQIRDYGHLIDDERAFSYIVKQLRIQVRNTYVEQKLKRVS